jgi:hypothetical protein
MQRYTIFVIDVNALRVSGGFFRPSSGAQNCTHSIWYMSSLLAAAAASKLGTCCCFSLQSYPASHQYLCDLSAKLEYCSNDFDTIVYWGMCELET